MSALMITPVTAESLPDMDHALRALATALGDNYKIGLEGLHHAFLGPHPACYGLLAYVKSGRDGADVGSDDGPNDGSDDGPNNRSDLAGAAVFSPILSTTTGGSGVQVSDLWVAEGARSQGTGQALLRAVANQAHAVWQARFLWLSCYADNTRALAFYHRLGFQATEGDIRLALAPAEFEQLRRAK